MFVGVRASSFHDVDAALRSDSLGRQLNVILEIAGIACIGSNARRFETQASATKTAGVAIASGHSRVDDMRLPVRIDSGS